MTYLYFVRPFIAILPNSYLQEYKNIIMGYKRECLTSATISHTSISETDTVTFEANLVTVWKKWVGAFPKYINAK